MQALRVLISACCVIARAGALPELVLMREDIYDPDWVSYTGRVFLPMPYRDGRDVPVVQYKVSCDPYLAETPWVSDENVRKKITVNGNCASYLKQDTAAVSFTMVNIYAKNVNVGPVPKIQTFNGFEIRDARPAISRSLLADCCDQAQCTDICLQETSAQQTCFVYFFTLTKYRYEENPFTVALNALGGTMVEAREGYNLELMFRIPCYKCMLKSCVEKCKNGQFASSYTEFSEVWAIAFFL